MGTLSLGLAWAMEKDSVRNQSVGPDSENTVVERDEATTLIRVSVSFENLGFLQFYVLH